MRFFRALVRRMWIVLIIAVLAASGCASTGDWSKGGLLQKCSLG